MNRGNKIFDVLPLLPLKSAGRVFYSYYCPEGMVCEKGSLVTIPFGPRLIEGLIWRESDQNRKNLKNIIKVDRLKIADETELRWLKDLSDKTLESLPHLAKSFCSVRRFSRNCDEKKFLSKKRNFSIHLHWREWELKKTLSKGKRGQVLFLIPEKIFSNKIAKLCLKANIPFRVFNQTAKKSEQKENIDWIMNGKNGVAIAAQSGIFLPFADLRTIVVYEAAHGSHVQWGMHPFYDAKLGALLRSREEGISVHYFLNCPYYDLQSIGREKVVVHGKMVSPKIALIRKEPNSDHPLTDEASRMVRDKLREKERVLIFHNMVGGDRFYKCSACGYVSLCEACGSLLQRMGSFLQCGECGKNHGPVRAFCPRCGSPRMSFKKTGTKAIEQMLLKEFPEYPVIRIDREMAGSKNDTGPFPSPAIIISTEKIFSVVSEKIFSMTVVSDSDMFFRPSGFDVLEKALSYVCRLSLLTKSEVILQTLSPETRFMQNLLNGKISGEIKADIVDRKKINYPPFAFMFFLTKEFTEKNQGEKEIKKIKEILGKIEKARVTAYLKKYRNKYSAEVALRLPSLPENKFFDKSFKNWERKTIIPLNRII